MMQDTAQRAEQGLGSANTSPRPLSILDEPAYPREEHAALFRERRSLWKFCAAGVLVSIVYLGDSVELYLPTTPLLSD
jgi:hypothetical protein